MSEKSTNRKINIWINGKQVTNTYKGITDSMRQARNELANMTIGSKEYLTQTKKLKQLQGILDEHRTKQGLIATGWRKITSNIKQIAVGNFISEGLTKVVDLFRSSFSKIITSISDFEGGMTNVFTLLSDNQVDQFSESLKKGSKEVAEMGFKMNDTNKSLFDAISAGVDAADSIDYLKEAAVLAKGGVTKLSTAVDGNTSVMNAYNLAVSEAGNINAAFFSAQKEGKTTVEELANSVGKVAPIAANVGVSYQELLSATAALTKKGISTSESMTYLKAAFSNLLKPSTDAEKILRKFGVPVGATEIKAVGLSGVLEKLNEVIKQSPDEIAKAIPSVEALTAVQALSGEGLEEYQRILKNVQTDIGENSSLQKAYKKQMESFPNIMAQASARLNNFAISLGEKLAPYIKEIIPMVSGWGKKVLELVDFLMRNIKTIAALGKVTLVAVASIKAYNVASKIQVMWSKAAELWNRRNIIATNLLRKANLLAALAQAKFTGNAKRAAAAQRALNIATKANPLGLVLGVVTAATTAYLAFRDSLEQTNTEQKILADIKLETNKRMGEERVHLDVIMRNLKDSNTSQAERKKLIGELNKSYGQYLPNLISEKASLKEIEKAYEAIVYQIRKKIELQVKEEKAKELREKIEERKANIAKEIQDSFGSFKFEDAKLSISNFGSPEEYAKAQKERILKEIKEMELAYKNLTTEMAKQMTVPEIGNMKGDTPENNASTNSNPTKTKKKELDQLKEYKEKYEKLRAKILAIRQQMNLSELSEEEKALEEIKIKFSEQKEVVEDSIAHLESIKEKKGKLNDEELTLLQRFYSQRNALEVYEEKELLAAQEQFAEKRLAAKQKVQKQIDETLMDAESKEVLSTINKYKELIALAEKHGLETTELYKKMYDEIAQIRDGYFVDTDIFGMTQNDWEKIKKDFEEVQQLANATLNVADAFFSLQSNKERAALEQYENNQAKKRKSLDERLEKGRISQEKYNKEIAKLDKELDIEKKKIAIADAKRTKAIRSFDTIINTAAAIVGFLANPGGIKGAALSTAAGITGGLQLAAINAEPLPKFAKGARVNQPTIAMVGEAGREIVLSNKIVDSPVYGALADDLARIQEGKTPRILGKKPNAPNFTGMQNALGSSVVNNLTTNNTTINQIDNEALNKVKEEISTMKESVKEMTHSIKSLKYLKAIISDDDLMEHEDEKRVRGRYEGF